MSWGRGVVGEEGRREPAQLHTGYAANVVREPGWARLGVKPTPLKPPHGEARAGITLRRRLRDTRAATDAGVAERRGCSRRAEQKGDAKPTTRASCESAWETFSPPHQPRYKRKRRFDGRTAISKQKRDGEGTHQSKEPRAQGKRGRISISCCWFPPPATLWGGSPISPHAF